MCSHPHHSHPHKAHPPQCPHTGAKGDPEPLLDTPSAPRETREALIQAILDTTVDGILTIDEAGLIQMFNPAAEKMFGYRAEEVIGTSINRLMASPDVQHHQHYVDRYMETGQARIIGIGREVTGMRRNGKSFSMELSVSELNVGNRRMFTGIVRDITSRKEVERALLEERHFVSAILNTVGAVVVVLDAQGRIVRFNRTCERITGYEAPEVLGKDFLQFLVPEDDRATSEKAFDALIRGEFVQDFESRLLCHDRAERRIAWSNTVLRNDDGQVEYMVATGLDVTERKEAEAALVSVSESERQEIGQELHDALGQVMTGISLLSGALERKLERQALPEQEDAAEISKLAKTALGEVRRLAHGLYPTELERHGLSSALQELVDSQRRLHTIRCTFESINRGDGHLDRPTQLHLYRIAQEALNNAVKHAGAGDLLITFYNDPTLLKLTVEDDGTGLPEGVLTKGMGLAIMRYRASQIGAEFDIGLRRRGGTRVECVLHHKLPIPTTNEEPAS